MKSDTIPMWITVRVVRDAPWSALEGLAQEKQASAVVCEDLHSEWSFCDRSWGFRCEGPTSWAFLGNLQFYPLLFHFCNLPFPSFHFLSCILSLALNAGSVCFGKRSVPAGSDKVRSLYPAEGGAEMEPGQSCWTEHAGKHLSIKDWRWMHCCQSRWIWSVLWQLKEHLVLFARWIRLRVCLVSKAFHVKCLFFSKQIVFPSLLMVSEKKSKIWKENYWETLPHLPFSLVSRAGK